MAGQNFDRASGPDFRRVRPGAQTVVSIVNGKMAARRREKRSGSTLRYVAVTFNSPSSVASSSSLSRAIVPPSGPLSLPITSSEEYHRVPQIVQHLSYFEERLSLGPAVCICHRSRLPLRKALPRSSRTLSVAFG